MSCTHLRRNPPENTLHANSDEQTQREPVAEILKEMGIKPLERQAVETYQKKYRKDALDAALREVHTEEAKYGAKEKLRKKERLRFNVFLIALCLLVAYAYHSATIALLGVPVIFVFSWLGNLMSLRIMRPFLDFAQRRNNYKIHMGWKTMTYDEYTFNFGSNAVPDFIKETVADIRQKLPEARFRVEYFDNDPFLIIEHSQSGCKDETVYAIAWDEKGLINL